MAWNSPAATAIHEATGLPVAAWGVVWGVAAAAAALFRLKSERNELNGAIRLLAAAGVLACLALTVLLLQNGAICMTCLVTYGLVLGYAAIAFWVPLGGVDWALGAAIAAGFCAVVFGLALLAGRDTPTETAQSGSVEVPDSGPPEEMLRDLIARLPEQTRTRLGEEFEKLREQEPIEHPTPRALVGSGDATVRITDFHDTLCPHCARLHAVLEHLRLTLPPGHLAIDARHFPLDASCNPALSSQGSNSVRCDASRALICLEEHPESFAFSSSVFKNQASLNSEMLFALAAPYMERGELAACMASNRTGQALLSDIRWAQEKGIRGTPFVFINGRQVPGFGPLVYALVLAGGDPNHPILADL